MRRPFTLLEVLLAFVLFGLLSWGLLEQLGSEGRLYQRARSRSEQARTLARADLKLQLLCDHLALPVGAKSPALSTCSLPGSSPPVPALRLYHCQSPQPEAELSGPVISYLFLDTQKRLCLRTYPISHTPELPGVAQQQILLSNLSQIQWTFFDPTSGRWTDEWTGGASMLPDMIRLDIGRATESWSWYYVLGPQKIQLPCTLSPSHSPSS